MKASSPRSEILRSQYLPSIELVRNVSKGCSVPRHFHEELELGVQYSDGWQFNYRGVMYSVPAETLIVIQPGEVHHADWIGDRDCMFRGLRISVDLLQQVAAEVAGRKTELPFFPMPLVHDRNLNIQIVQVHQALEQSISQLEQQSLILDLLAQIILRHAQAPPCLAKLGGGHQLERVRAYIEDHYNQEISLKQLAQIANLSSFHLNRAFRKRFGMPPHAYQVQVRILRAKQMLKKERSIAKVATEVGFASQSHFGSRFRRFVCMTPMQYVKTARTW